MNFRGIALALAAALSLSLTFAGTAMAQLGAGAAGVEVDPNGVLRMVFATDADGRLTRMRLEEARAKMTGDLAKPSEMRKISLQRLEKALQAKLEASEPIAEEMRYLAGLTRVQYVFYYPETKDIVLAGPAEPFAIDLTGRPVGVSTGAAIVELQDLVTALRAFSPQGDRAANISVSIDPTKEGLQRMQEFLKRIGRNASPAQTDAIVGGLRESLGQQTVSVKGVPSQTHFAQALVEADYRMKLIGIGLERPTAPIVSYVEKSKPGTGSRNALQRWYFTPNYDCVLASEDGLAMELEGSGVKLVGASELVAATGEREATGGDSIASKAFTKSFTDNYADLAKTTPVYAQLRNLIDLSIVAAYIQRNDFYARSDWAMPVFGDESAFPVETYRTPEKVETAVNAVWKGSTLMTPIGGGVSIHPLRALEEGNLRKDADGALNQTRSTVDLSGLPEGKWWWD